MTMKEKTLEIVDLSKELMKLCAGQALNSSSIEHMDADGLKALQLTMKLFNKSIDLAVAQAEMMDSQNKKLDELLMLVKKKGV